MNNSGLGVTRSSLIGTGFAIAIFSARLFFPERALTATGISSIWDHFFAISLWLIVVGASSGLGLFTLTKLGVAGKLGAFERQVFSVSTGLAISGFSHLAMGLLGAYRPIYLSGYYLIVLLFMGDYWRRIFFDLAELAHSAAKSWQERKAISKIAILLCAGIFSISFLQTLTPPWSFDALMYHLAAPEKYLEAGRLLLLPDMWQANGPMSIQLIYGVGLAFGSTSTARLLHLTFSLLLVAATFGSASRIVDQYIGSISVLLLISIPILPIWSNIANIDLAWAHYEFMAIYFVLIWYKNHDRKWLLLSGLMAGFAASTKYVGLAAIPTAVILILAASLSKDRLIKSAISPIAAFLLTAILIGSPWYVLNLVRAGNPIYPFVWGGPGWDQERLSYLMAFLQSFGADNKLVSTLLAPVWIYTRRELYTSFLSRIEIPSLIFPLALLTPLVKPPAGVALLGVSALCRYFLWAISSQQTRFFLPLFPSLAILSSFVIYKILSGISRKRTRSIIVSGLIGGLLISTFFYQLLHWQLLSPMATIIGRESKDSFLQRNLPIYSAQRYLVNQLPVEARALLLWDGQVYYCLEKCIGDAEQSKWTQLVQEYKTAGEIADRLESEGIDYLIAKTDAMNFFLNHDPFNWHSQAVNFYLNDFRPNCTENILSTSSTSLDRITCER